MKSLLQSLYGFYVWVCNNVITERFFLFFCYVFKDFICIAFLDLVIIGTALYSFSNDILQYDNLLKVSFASFVSQ